LLAPLHGPARRRNRPQARERAARAAAPRRHVVELVRRPRGPVDDGRVVRRTPDGRRRSGAGDAALHPARGWDPEVARLHEVLPRAPRRVAVAADPEGARGADPAAAERAVLDLQPRMLGAADGRPALGP